MRREVRRRAFRSFHAKEKGTRNAPRKMLAYEEAFWRLIYL
jgi:hypothetical protein